MIEDCAKCGKEPDLTRAPRRPPPAWSTIYRISCPACKDGLQLEGPDLNKMVARWNGLQEEARIPPPPTCAAKCPEWRPERLPRAG